MLRALPPKTSRHSQTDTAKPRSMSSCAALNPPTPPPRMTTRFAMRRYSILRNHFHSTGILEEYPRPRQSHLNEVREMRQVLALASISAFDPPWLSKAPTLLGQYVRIDSVVSYCFQYIPSST